MPRSRSKKQLSLRITDFSDRELLAIVFDRANADGHADITHVAEAIWPNAMKTSDGAFHGRHCVAIRFSHMRRMGVMEKVKDQPGMWELTELGEVFIKSDVSKAQEDAILRAQTGQELELMSLVGDLYESVGEEAATLMRREFQFRAYRRRWG